MNSEKLVFENPSDNEDEKALNKGLQSKVLINTANNSKIARSNTIHYLHLSEVAFWEKADVTMLGLLQSVPNLSNTAIIVESTANGVGNYFHKLWKDSVEGKNSFIPVFLPWFQDDGYKLSFDTLEERQAYYDKVYTIYKDTNGEEIKSNELHLVEMVEKEYGIILSLEQLKWREWCINNNCGGDEELFKQEYPTIPLEAFLSTGRPVFNTGKLNKYLRNVKDGKIGNLVTSNGRVVFEENPKGLYEIFNFPREDRYYCIGSDVAEGLKNGDYSTAIVGNNEDLCVDCVFRGHLEADLFGLELIKLANFYNGAYLGVECNNNGLATLKTIVNNGYYNVYYSKVYDMVADKVTKKLGWHTNSKTKPLMINKLAEFIREEYIIIKSKSVIEELFFYMYDDRGKTNAVSGEHDDLVIALSVWLQLILEGMGENFTPTHNEDTRPIKNKSFSKFSSTYHDTDVKEGESKCEVAE